MEITTIGIDLAKNIFQVHAVNKSGKKVFNKQVRRSQLAEFVSKLPVCLIGLEACCGSNYWARVFESFGHTVKVMAPQFVKPFVKGNKTDRNDAEAICEAVQRPSMRFVSKKTIHQQDIQALHRIRSRVVSQKTQLMNQIRGLLLEYGIAVKPGVTHLRKRLVEITDDAYEVLTPTARGYFKDCYDELVCLIERANKYEKQLTDYAKSNEACQRLMTIRGIGPLSATAYTAGVGDGKVFSRGRQVSAWLGLVPRQSSSGGKTRLLGISKRGDRYLRCLLVHGARAAIKAATNKDDSYSRWIHRLVNRIGVNKAAVAIANKNARMAWALLTKGGAFNAGRAICAYAG